MYLGEMVEIGASETVFDHPAHPYTQALLASTPIPDPQSGGLASCWKGRFPVLPTRRAAAAFIPAARW